MTCGGEEAGIGWVGGIGWLKCKCKKWVLLEHNTAQCPPPVDLQTELHLIVPQRGRRNQLILAQCRQVR